jgi:hypothetical protein
MTERSTPPCGYALHHERRRGLSRLILLRDGVPLGASQTVSTRELAAWMRRYDVPFTGLVRTGWAPGQEQWPAILKKWFPDLLT